MRIWSIHPQYLDSKGLVALWREGLLAQNVLLKKTRGYKNHPQLVRFKEQEDPLQALSNYLHFVCDEADQREYNFNRNKIHNAIKRFKKINVTSKQLDYEWMHFLKKIKIRDKVRYEKLKRLKEIAPHPLFQVVTGELETWERV
jgi:hypothetical protein